MSASPGAGDGNRRADEPWLRRIWRNRAVLGVTVAATAAGFAQFGLTVALGDLAAAFGEPQPDGGVSAQIGMTGTTVGIGLAVVRLASLASLPAAGLADRLGRRRVLLTCTGVGLALTALAGLMPTWWWFVAVFAAGRPLLASVSAVGGVVAAEETSSSDRSAAIALVGAGYAVGTGVLAVTRGAAADVLGHRGVFLLALLPLAALPLVARHVTEPARYERARADVDPARRPRLGAVPADLRGRLAIICFLHLGVGLVTGPINSYLFVYGEQVLGAAPALMSGIYVAAGATGLAGLLLGRWTADRFGRRLTAGLSMAVVALAGLLTYSGGIPAMAAGFLVTGFGASAFAPSAGALDAEVFPTSVRSTVAGWVSAMQVLGAVAGLLAFGALADVVGEFSVPAAAVTLPVVALAVLYRLLPETRGLELEESAPEVAGR